MWTSSGSRRAVPSGAAKAIPSGSIASCSLQEMKDKGATHVEMEYHCDHISYPIYGYRITHADQADIDELERKKTQAEKLAAEAKELRAKLREIEDQRRSLT